MKLKDKLIKLDACSEAIEWVGSKSLSEAWATCERGDWMVWILKKSNLCDLRTLTAIKAAQVEPIRHLLTHQRSIAALDAAHAFGRGEISEDELRAAAAAAAAAASDAAAAAAYYAAYAAYAAAYADAAAAASDAAYAAAYSAAYDGIRYSYLKKCADIVRQFIPSIKIDGIE